MKVLKALLVTVFAFTAFAAPASAAPPVRLDRKLAALWTKVLETPSDQNPFGAGGPATACFDLGRTVAPFAPESVAGCTVSAGTSILVIGHSNECSTFEGNGNTDAELRTCARGGDSTTAPTILVDNHNAQVSEAETPLLRLVLPTDNIFGLPGRTHGLSVAHGWVALVHPLNPGTHNVVINDTITTTITVEPCSTR